ncbi:MAG: hypothetical protein ACXWWD_02240 [Chitinophagaceae bacterium]
MRNIRKARAVGCSSPLERLGEAKDPTVKFDVTREQKRAKEWKPLSPPAGGG